MGHFFFLGSHATKNLAGMNIEPSRTTNFHKAHSKCTWSTSYLAGFDDPSLFAEQKKAFPTAANGRESNLVDRTNRVVPLCSCGRFTCSKIFFFFSFLTVQFQPPLSMSTPIPKDSRPCFFYGSLMAPAVLDSVTRPGIDSNLCRVNAVIEVCIPQFESEHLIPIQFFVSTNVPLLFSPIFFFSGWTGLCAPSIP